MPRQGYSRRGPGRPRKSGKAAGGEVRAGILDAAMRLFARKGFADTTMSAIAREAGLDQSSLYYWFRNKEDLFAQLIVVNEETARAARLAQSQQGSVPARLYSVVHDDVLRLCASPFDYYDLESVACSQPESFPSFFEGYDALLREVRLLIEAGVADGSLRAPNPLEAARTALALSEGAQHRFHSARVFARASQGDAAKPFSAEDAARQVARMVVGSMLVGCDVDDVARFCRDAGEGRDAAASRDGGANEAAGAGCGAPAIG